LRKGPGASFSLFFLFFREIFKISFKKIFFDLY